MFRLGFFSLKVPQCCGGNLKTANFVMPNKFSGNKVIYGELLLGQISRSHFSGGVYCIIKIWVIFVFLL